VEAGPLTAVAFTPDGNTSATAGVTPLHRADRDFAVFWVKRYGKGRVFYGMFGHIGGPFQSPAVLQHYLDGIQYALGDLEAEDTPEVVKK
jgi:type 1 glutamine amidotransferase